VRVQVQDRLGLESTAQISVEIVFAEDVGLPVSDAAPFTLPFAVGRALVDAGNAVMWAIDSSGQRLAAVDLAAGTIAGEFSFTEGRARAMALSRDGLRLAVALTIPDPDGPYLDPIRYDAGQLAVFDTARLVKVAHHAIDFAPMAVQLTTDGVVVVEGAASDGLRLATFDAASGIERNRQETTSGYGEVSLAMHASQRRVYVSGWGGPGLRRFELFADGRLEETPTPGAPTTYAGSIWADTVGRLLLAKSGQVLATVDDPARDLTEYVELPPGYAWFEQAVFDDDAGIVLIARYEQMETWNTSSFAAVGSPRPLDGARFAGLARDSVYTLRAVEGGTRIERGPHPAIDGGSNEPPTAAFSIEPPTPTPGVPVTLDASASADPNDGLAGLRFRWDVEGDGTWDTEFTPDPVLGVRYDLAGSRAVRLQVRDRLGLESTVTRPLNIPVPASQRLAGPLAPLFTIPASARDAAVESVRPFLWLPDTSARRVVGVDLESGLVKCELGLGGGPPERIALSPNGRVLAVSLPMNAGGQDGDPPGDGIALVDPVACGLIDLLRTPYDISDVAVGDDGGPIIVGSYMGQKLIARYDPDKRREPLSYSLWGETFEVVLHPSGRRAYVQTESDGLLRFDWGETGGLILTARSQISWGVSAGTWIDPSGEVLVVGASLVFDLTEDPPRDLASWRFPLGNGFEAVAWDAGNKEMYAASAGTITRFNDVGRLQLESVPGPANVLALGRYGRRTYVAYKDGTRTLVSALDVNHSPVADAGPDQVVECDGTSAVPVTLDGTRSDDYDSRPGTKDDILLYAWQEGGAALASGEAATASVPLALGRHDLTLTVTDQLRASDDDALTVDVRDTLPPAVTITAPAPLACFGPDAVPVTVEASAADRCATVSDLTYDPPGGPSYDRHGDYAVTVTARDPSGNSGSSSVPFTIDLVRPTVRLIQPPGGWVIPRNAPFGFSFTSADDDGAAGGPAHELVTLDGCLFFDGNTFGDQDGLLTDETLLFDDAAICAAIARCGVGKWVDPKLAVEVRDCGGNAARATKTLRGTITPNPSLCAPRRPRGLQPDLR
jgi:hypothetical protein